MGVNKQMMPPQNNNKNRNSVNMNMNGAKGGGPNNGGMPFPILSEEFMNNMMNMDFSKMNGNKHNAQNSQGKMSMSKPQLYNPQNQMPPPPKHNNMQYINDMMQPQNNRNHNPLLSQQSAPQVIMPMNNGYGQAQKQKAQISVQPIVNEPESVDPIEGELVSMGFEKEYVVRACNLYKKKFKNKPLRLEVLTEIIIRLQQRDQSKKRSHSIDEIDNSQNKVAAAPKHRKKRSSFSGVQKYKNEQMPLQQSISQPPLKYNNHNQQMQHMIHHQHQSSAEQVVITLVMPSSSIGLQTAEIVMRRDQTLADLKRLASTCLTDFDQYDMSYAFFHDDSGFIFTEFDVSMTQALQLMDVDVNNADNINVIVKIGRVVSKYIKLKK